jgi:hypothetical protein
VQHVKLVMLSQFLRNRFANDRDGIIEVPMDGVDILGAQPSVGLGRAGLDAHKTKG